MIFFISCPLGMEAALQQEFTEVWPWLLDLDGRPHGESLPEMHLEIGGLSFSTQVHLGLQLNFHLKIANRILMRLAQFRCRDFPKLFQMAKKTPWRDWLNTNNPGLQVAASQSRLNHEKRIVETLSDAWSLKRETKDKHPTEANAEQIYVRIHDDNVSISLDTTGEHLHFRGFSKFVGEAPLRETIAAFCLQKLKGDSCRAELAQIELVDPMMGSGTFLSEAITMAEPLHREFTFQKWKKSPKALLLPEFARAWRQGRVFWRSLRGSDIDPQFIQIAGEHIDKLKKVFSLSEFSVDLFRADVFSQEPLLLAPRRRWLVVNPPYGERIEWRHSSEALLKALQHQWQPERMAIIWTERQARQAPTTLGSLRCQQSYPLQNGGLKVQLQIWSS